MNLNIFKRKQLPSKQEEPRIVIPDVYDQWTRYTTFSGNLDPTKLISILQNANQGYVRLQYDLFTEMEERDTHLASVLQTRQKAVAGLDWRVIPFSEENPQDLKIAEFIEEQIRGLKDFEQVIEDLMTAIGYGLAVSEIVWKNSFISSIHNIRQQRFTFMTSTDPRLLTVEFPVNGKKLDEYLYGSFIVHTSRVKSGLINRAGLLRILVVLYMFKSFTLKNWGIFCEVFGMPIRVGRYTQNATAHEIDTLKQAIQLLGSDAAAVIPDNLEIDIIERKGGGGGVGTHNIFLQWIDKQMSKCVLGQTLTTEIGEKGSYAAAQVHDAVRQDILISDAKALARTIRWQLIKPLVVFNFGLEANIPRFRFDYETKPDLNAEAEKDKIVFKEIGLPVAKNFLYEKYQVPEPQLDEELLEIPQSMSPFGGGGEEGEEEALEAKHRAEKLQLYRSKIKKKSYQL